MNKLCLPLAESALPSLERKIGQYRDQVDYIEVRLDYLSSPSLPSLPTESRAEFLATCRPPREGGRFEGTERDRLQLLSAAAHNGFAWVDLEHDVDQDPDLPSSTRVVRSVHCFDRLPDDLPGLFEKLESRGGDVVKIAATVSSTRELVKLLSWMESLPDKKPYTVLGMGGLGQPSRFLGAFLGNFWTFVCENAEQTVAPGQFGLEQATNLYRLDSWESTPVIYGILGNPVAHSRSPQLHNRLFQHHRLDNLYLPFQLDELEPWIEYVRSSRLRFAGFSVTLPFKTDAAELADSTDSPVASINTLCRSGSGWKGLNTDYPAFLAPLTSQLSLQQKRALVLGNGGVAHTVVAGLKNEGARVVVVGRNQERVSHLASHYGCSHALFSDLPLAADLCVNTTPVGQYPLTEASPLSQDQLRFDLVYDLIYHPEQTQLLQMAAQKGAQTISGMEMFIEQGALQFLAWTGLDPNRAWMRDLLNQMLAEEEGSPSESIAS